MSLYPSLYPTIEDMKVSELIEAQKAHEGHAPQQPAPAAITGATGNTGNMPLVSLYPSLTSYMGLELSTVAPAGNASGSSGSGTVMVAPVTAINTIGMKRAEVKPGLRKVTLCKDAKGKMGLFVKEINKGIFVSCVCVNSPAALAGLRFGDQILEINGEVVAGFSTDKAIKRLKTSPSDKITLVIRDRPFERTVTLNKDSTGVVGFLFDKNGKITDIVKDSSAARNGLLIDHYLIEVDGRNVVAMKEKEVQQVIQSSPQSVTVTVMPAVLYEHMVKCIGTSDLRKYMDHSVPDV